MQPGAGHAVLGFEVFDQQHLAGAVFILHDAESLLGGAEAGLRTLVCVAGAFQVIPGSGDLQCDLLLHLLVLCADFFGFDARFLRLAFPLSAVEQVVTQADLCQRIGLLLVEGVTEALKSQAAADIKIGDFAVGVVAFDVRFCGLHTGLQGGKFLAFFQGLADEFFRAVGGDDCAQQRCICLHFTR